MQMDMNTRRLQQTKLFPHHRRNHPVERLVERAPLYVPVNGGPSGHLGDDAQQLRLEDELALLVFLARLVRLVVLPPDTSIAAAAVDVPHDMPAGGHITFVRFGAVDVDDVVEEVGLTVLAAEVLAGRGRSAALFLLDLGYALLGCTRLTRLRMSS